MNAILDIIVPVFGPVRVSPVDTKVALGNFAESNAAAPVSSPINSLLITLTLPVSMETSTALFSGADGLKFSVPLNFSNRP